MMDPMTYYMSKWAEIKKLNKHEFDYVKKFFIENPIPFNPELAEKVVNLMDCKIYVLGEFIEEFIKLTKQELSGSTLGIIFHRCDVYLYRFIKFIESKCK